MGKHLCEIFKNTYSEEHLCLAASELNFVSGSHLKPSRLGNITKIQVTFKPDLQKKFGIYVVYIFNPYAFL